MAKMSRVARGALAAFLMLLCAPGASPADRAGSATPAATHRRRSRYKHLKPGPRGPRHPLRAEGWRPEVRQALEKLMETRGDKSKTYSAEWPPVAVLMLDGVLIGHHAGEVAFLRLVERAEFRFSSVWWSCVPREVRARARRAYKRLSQRAEAAWAQDEDYLDWRKAMFEGYRLLCRRDGRRACRTWLTSLMAGFSEGESEAYMRETVDEALRGRFALEDVRANAGDEKPIRAERGLRRVPAMMELERELLRAGFDVWVLSSSNQWIAEAIAGRCLDVNKKPEEKCIDSIYTGDRSAGKAGDDTRVVGVRARVLNKRIQPDIVDPVPIGPGAAEAITLFIGRSPELVIAEPADVEVLEQGKGLRIAIDRGDKHFAARAEDRGWLLQPELPPGPPEAQ